MNAAAYRTAWSFEDSLDAGSAVVVRWTSSGAAYVAKATVKRANALSVRVTLDESVPASFGEPYPAGHEVVVPRLDDIARWSVNNRVEPRDGYTVGR